MAIKKKIATKKSAPKKTPRKKTAKKPSLKFTSPEELQKSSFYLNSISDAVIVINEKREITRVNKEFSNLWGYSFQEVLNRDVFQLFPKIERHKHIPYMKEAIKTKKPQNFETLALTKSGRKVPLSIKGSAIFDKSGKLEGFIGVFRDITERKNAEESIKESERKYRDLFDNANDGICTVDTSGNITICNREFAKMFGYTEKEIIGKNTEDFIHPKDRKRVLEIQKKRFMGKDVPTVYEFLGVKKTENPYI